MNNPKSKSKLMNFIYFIIAFLIVFLFLFIIYENFIKIKKPSGNVTTSTSLTQEQIDTLGKEKFDWLNAQLKVNNNKPIFFTNATLNTVSIDNNDVLSILYNALSSDDHKGTGNTDNSCFSSSDLSSYPTNCYKETFDKSILTEKAKKYFSTSLNINYTDFTAAGSKYCYFNNNSYTCVLKVADIKIADILILTGYDTSKIENDKLEVSSYLLTVKRDLDVYKDSEKGIYSDLDGTNKIDNLDAFKSLTSSGLNANTTKEIIDKYKDRITIFKSTFTKIDDNYVWESTSIEQ